MPKRNDILSLISRYRTELMGFAALWILLYHEWWPVFEGSLPGKAEHFLTEMGFYGVDIFSRAVVNFVVPVSFSSSYSTCISLRVLAQYRGIAGTEAITVFRIGRTLYAVFHGLLPAEA